MKKAFDGLINRLDTAEERISKLEDNSRETFQIEKQEKIKQNRISKNNGTITKRCMIHEMALLEREEQGKEKKKQLKTVTENFPKLMSNTKIQIQASQRTISRVNAKNTTWVYNQTTKNPT